MTTLQNPESEWKKIEHELGDWEDTGGPSGYGCTYIIKTRNPKSIIIVDNDQHSLMLINTLWRQSVTNKAENRSSVESILLRSDLKMWLNRFYKSELQIYFLFDFNIIVQCFQVALYLRKNSVYRVFWKCGSVLAL